MRASAVRIGFVGCGAAGRPLGVAWRRRGHAIGGVHCRRTAAEAVAVLGGGVPGGPLDDAEVVVFATPDDALATAAREHRLRPEQVALHLSGAHPSTILAPTGARAASLHPLCAFAGVEAALAALPKTYVFVEGEAADVAEGLARDLGGPVARIETDKKTLYHAGAAIAANYSVTLLAVARDLFRAAGVEERLALDALVQLARGALDNVARVGPAKGLTGPAARGDAAVVARHLDALPEDLRAFYRTLLAATIPLARAKGTLSPEAEAALRGLAAPGPPL